MSSEEHVSTPCERTPQSYVLFHNSIGARMKVQKVEPWNFADNSRMAVSLYCYTDEVVSCRACVRS